jgi:hypothetical protein
MDDSPVGTFEKEIHKSNYDNIFSENNYITKKEYQRRRRWQQDISIKIGMILIGIGLGIIGISVTLILYRQEIGDLVLQLNNPCEAGFNEEGCDNISFSEWCKDLADTGGPEEASICLEYCNSMIYPIDGTNEQKERFCQFKTTCQVIGTDNSSFVNSCSSCTASTVYEGITPLGLCDSFDFNYICFNYSSFESSCKESCHFPDIFPDDFREYMYCSVLPEYKYLNPCLESFSNPVCQANNNIQDVFCQGENEYCSHAPDYIFDKFINSCYCRCLLGGDNCGTSICEKYLSPAENERICGSIS